MLGVKYPPGGGPDKTLLPHQVRQIRRVLPRFGPPWTAGRGVQELRDAYRAAGLTLEDLERGRYVRISHIRRLLNAGQLDASLRLSQRPAETAVVA